eukprot:6214140-Pleurochrysis_carterae.AAC.1
MHDMMRFTEIKLRGASLPILALDVKFRLFHKTPTLVATTIDSSFQSPRRHPCPLRRGPDSTGRVAPCPAVPCRCHRSDSDTAGRGVAVEESNSGFNS